MIKPLNISWSETKKNVESVIKKYIYYNLSLDSSSEFKINKDFSYNMIDERDINDAYIRLSSEEIKDRVKYINYVRFSYNKLNCCERKII